MVKMSTAYEGTALINFALGVFLLYRQIISGKNIRSQNIYIDTSGFSCFQKCLIWVVSLQLL